MKAGGIARAALGPFFHDQFARIALVRLEALVAHRGPTVAAIEEIPDRDIERIVRRPDLRGRGSCRSRTFGRPLPARSAFAGAVPGDLKLNSIELTLRGSVAKGSKPGLFLTPRSARSTVLLVNLEEKPKPEEDRLAKLEKAMGGKNRFEIAGEWREEKGVERLALRSFNATDWKD